MRRLVGSEREPRAPLLAAGAPGGTGAGGAGGAWGGGSFGAGPGGVAWWAWVLALAQLGAAALLLAQGRPPVPTADIRTGYGAETPEVGASGAALQTAGGSGGLAGGGAVELAEVGVTLRFPVTSDALERRATPAFDDELPEASVSGEKPLISVVLASYNQGAFIQETLESVAGQDYPHWELVVVDDGSSDDSWSRVGKFMSAHPELRVLALRKENGGLADARNAGLLHVRGEWVAMLDSDDLYGKMYFERVAELASLGADIVPGCMVNFGAFSSTWCFPEGWSVTGVAYWNKFHAAVPFRRALAEQVGGYDPSIPWGLEDWNFWLSSSLYNPVVKFVPEATFYYRHHAKGSMRKEMFAKSLDVTKAMVRTNHPSLFEPAQLLIDHATIAEMNTDTLEKVRAKVERFPLLPQPHFWLGLHHAGRGEPQNAIACFVRSAKLLEEGREGGRAAPELLDSQWQVYYHLGRALVATGESKRALHAVDLALQDAYFDDLLELRHSLQDRLALQTADKLSVKPTYWSDKNFKTRQAKETLTGKMQLADKMATQTQSSLQDSLRRAVALLQTLDGLDCSRIDKQPWENLVRNSGFESTEDPTQEAFGWVDMGNQPSLIVATSPRPRSLSRHALQLRTTSINDQTSGARQTVRLDQTEPGPLFISAWSKSREVVGREPFGYSLYIDVTFADGEKEYRLGIPFESGTMDWHQKQIHIVRQKPIRSLDIYCMLRYHTGTAWFDDIVVTPLARAACACPPGHLFQPAGAADGTPTPAAAPPLSPCEKCPTDDLCVLGHAFRLAV